MQNKVAVKTKDVDNKDIELFINIPTNRIIQDAQMQYNAKLAQLIRDSANGETQFLTRGQLQDYLRKLGIWTEKDQTRFIQLQLEIRDLELKLSLGGIKLSEAKNIAIDISRKRTQLLDLYNKRSKFDSVTIESIAENHKFKFTLIRCSVDSSGQPYFKNMEDYENRQGEFAAIDLAQQLASMAFGYNKDFATSLPEYQWLKKHNFMNNDGELIDQDGHCIDLLGKRVDKNGRWINEDGQLVDIDDNVINEEGDFIVEDPKPFLDENGNPIDNE